MGTFYQNSAATGIAAAIRQMQFFLGGVEMRPADSGGGFPPPPGHSQRVQGRFSRLTGLSSRIPRNGL